MSDLHKTIEDAYKYKQNINDETFKAYVAELMALSQSTYLLLAKRKPLYLYLNKA